jgi:hypothetical protein
MREDLAGESRNKERKSPLAVVSSHLFNNNKLILVSLHHKLASRSFPYSFQTIVDTALAPTTCRRRLEAPSPETAILIE